MAGLDRASAKYALLLSSLPGRSQARFSFELKVGAVFPLQAFETLVAKGQIHGEPVLGFQNCLPLCHDWRPAVIPAVSWTREAIKPRNHLMIN